MLGLLAALASGCFLQSTFGRTVVTSNKAAGVNEVQTELFGDATFAPCRAGSGSRFDCAYEVAGDALSSTLFLRSEPALSVVAGPLVFQVPDDTLSVTATFRDGNVELPAALALREAFEADPRMPVARENGTRFLIMDIPAGVQPAPAGTRYRFTLHFAQRRPLTATLELLNLKMMLTARVVVNGHNYYVPLLPCVANFADAPAMTVPISESFVNVQASFGDILFGNQSAPCNGQSYDYTGAPAPFDRVIYLPVVSR